MITQRNPLVLDIEKVIEFIDSESTYFKHREYFSIEKRLIHEEFAYLTISFHPVTGWTILLWCKESFPFKVSNDTAIVNKIEQLNEYADREMEQCEENK